MTDSTSDGLIPKKRTRKAATTPSEPKKPRSRTPKVTNADAAPLLYANPEVAKPIGGVPASSGLRQFFPTNQLNLAAILSCGYIKPRRGFLKYYQDLLDIGNGWIPLVYEPFDDWIVKEITAEVPALPVAVELQSTVATAGAVSIGGSMVLVGSPISASEIRRIHFRSVEDRDEVAARLYEGVDLTWFELSVTPELFTSDDRALGDRAWLSAHAPNPAIQNFELIDRMAGAVAGVLAASATISVNPADLAVMLGFGRGTLDAEVLRNVDFEKADTQSGDDLDAILFSAAMRVLRGTDRFESWDPAQIVKGVRDAISSGRNAAAALIDMLRRMWRIVRLEAPYEDFGSKEGGNAANALLWVLMRPDPNDVLDPPGGVNASDWTRVATVMLSGILNGFELQPSSVRTERIARFMWDWQALVLSGFPMSPESLETQLIVVDGGWTLTSKGAAIASGRYAAIQRPQVEDPLAEIEANGWHECLTYEISADAQNSVITVQGGRIIVRLVGPVDLQRSVNHAAYRLRKG